MRRAERQVTDTEQIFEILNICEQCSVAFFDGEFPYIVPLSFGAALLDGKITLYFHCAKEGRKMELLKKNNAVAFEASRTGNLVTGDTACAYSMKYKSVCGNGYIEIVHGAEKLQALKTIMKHYTNKEPEFDMKAVESVCVLKLECKNISGKQNI